MQKIADVVNQNNVRDFVKYFKEQAGLKNYKEMDLQSDPKVSQAVESCESDIEYCVANMIVEVFQEFKTFSVDKATEEIMKRFNDYFNKAYSGNSNDNPFNLSVIDWTFIVQACMEIEGEFISDLDESEQKEIVDKVINSSSYKDAKKANKEGLKEFVDTYGLDESEPGFLSDDLTLGNTIGDYVYENKALTKVMNAACSALD